MPSSKIKNEEFGKSYEDFVSSNNPVFHRKAIENMLGMIGLKGRFKKSLKFGINRVEDTYCNFVAPDLQGVIALRFTQGKLHTSGKFSILFLKIILEKKFLQTDF